jgi:lysophospholipase L1-like esterase
MLDANGKPRPDLFRKDGLHMNAQGYAIWVSIVKPVLMNRFAPGSQ